MYEVTAEDIKKAKEKQEQERRRIKTAFNYVKQLSLQKFIDFMNQKHSAAYFLCREHFDLAMDIALTPKQKKAVLEQFEKVRGEWDGIDTIQVDYSEFDLYDIMVSVHTEMRRAARIHGENFRDYAEAKEAIQEEIAEIWEAAERGDINHAKTEAIQAIGVLVKFLRMK